MILLDIDQNSPEWYSARRGKPTASRAADVLSKGRGKQESQTRSRYMMELLSERVLDPEDDVGFAGNQHTRRGHEHEPEAAEQYRFINDDYDVWTVGFITTDDGRIGASPDLMVDTDREGIAEIKSKIPELYLPVLLNKSVPAEHEPQIQTQLWVSEREFCDFLCYWPNLPLVEIRVWRDEKRIKQIAEEYTRFADELDALENKLRRLL